MSGCAALDMHTNKCADVKLWAPGVLCRRISNVRLCSICRVSVMSGSSALSVGFLATLGLLSPVKWRCSWLGCSRISGNAWLPELGFLRLASWVCVSWVWFLEFGFLRLVSCVWFPKFGFLSLVSWVEFPEFCVLSLVSYVWFPELSFLSFVSYFRFPKCGFLSLISLRLVSWVCVSWVWVLEFGFLRLLSWV